MLCRATKCVLSGDKIVARWHDSLCRVTNRGLSGDKLVLSGDKMCFVGRRNEFCRVTKYSFLGDKMCFVE